MLAAILILSGVNLALIIALMILDLKYKADKVRWVTIKLEWDREKDLEIQKIHAQWKQYADKIKPPGHA